MSAITEILPIPLALLFLTLHNPNHQPIYTKNSAFQTHFKLMNSPCLYRDTLLFDFLEPTACHCKIIHNILNIIFTVARVILRRAFPFTQSKSILTTAGQPVWSLLPQYLWPTLAALSSLTSSSHLYPPMVQIQCISAGSSAIALLPTSNDWLLKCHLRSPYHLPHVVPSILIFLDETI